MASYSLEIRDAAVDAVATLPAWADRAHPRRVIPTTEAQVPCVLVHMGTARYQMSGDGVSGAYEFRVNDELIVSVVMAKDEELVDEKAAEVLGTLLTDWKLNQLLEGVRDITRTVEIPKQENLTLIEVRHVITVQYSHRFEPNITDDFEGVDLRTEKDHPEEPATRPVTGFTVDFPPP